MLTVGGQLVPNSAEVAASVVDGEAIIINLSNGMYYSLDRVGGFVWELITARRTVGQILEAIVQHYDVTREQAGNDLDRLVSELIAENLVITSDDGTQAAWPPAPAEAAHLPYIPPRLEIYRDLGDLMAMDPPMPPLSEIISSKPA